MFHNEYYTTYIDLIIPHLCNPFNHIADEGTWPKDSLEVLIVNIPTPGKPSDNLVNFHPISLLNINMKFYTKYIASRVAEPTPLLVHPDQVGLLLYDNPRIALKDLLIFYNGLSTT